MAIWARRNQELEGLLHHSDRGAQYLAIRYTERLAEAGAVRPVGSRGDSYDNALAETVVGLYKAELIRRRGPRRTLEQVEPATAADLELADPERLTLSALSEGSVRDRISGAISKLGARNRADARPHSIQERLALDAAAPRRPS
jgi:transposase InsO family protein